MLRLLPTLAIFLAVVAFRPQAAGPPKLLVMVVVDQLRADYLQEYGRHWQRGFKTLLDEGLVFENARYPYLNTVTCAGHATIGTGALPRTHGMVLNAWWNRDARRTLDCTADGEAADISFGRPVRGGNSARLLAVPTLADELRAQKPGARVAALSLKARSAIGLAGHGGDAVIWFDDLAGSFATSRAYAQGPVPVVKEFVDSEPHEKDLGRVWALTGNASSYLRPDAGVGERPPAPWNGLFPHVVAGRGGMDTQFFDVWQTSPLSDAYLGRMAAAILDGLALGQRDTTDFLGVSFSALDEVGHDFGPDSRETEDVLRQLDVTLGLLIERLDARIGRANYMLALTADHGVAPIAGFERGGKIATEDMRERIEDTLRSQFGPLEKGTYVDAVNFTYIYLAPGVFDRLKATPAAMAALDRAVKQLPGISHFLRGDELSEHSADPAVRAAAFSHFAGRSGDLVAIPKPYWYFSPRNVSAATTHGTFHAYDTHVPVIVFGGGVGRGRVTTAATPADIAPTLAQAAGVRLAKAEGRNLVK